VRMALAVIFLPLPAAATCCNQLQAPTKGMAKGLGAAVEQGPSIAHANAPGGVLFDRGKMWPRAIAAATELGKSGFDHLRLAHHHAFAIRAAAAGPKQLCDDRGAYLPAATAAVGRRKISQPPSDPSQVARLSAASKSKKPQPTHSRKVPPPRSAAAKLSIDQLKGEASNFAVLARGAAEHSRPVFAPRPLRQSFRQNLELNRSPG
jgi:hypothetical protein